ncbi:MAG: helix-turn-helix transcriptional regulator [Candidatus Promineifilaceae bacterium]|nr:helix-turn-helix transcriptional regulator [Anaerolineaceae bacterium]
MARTSGEGLANKIRELRARDRLTQADLADQIEVSRQTVSAIENGEYNPSVVLALRIAQLFNEPVETIFWLAD